jgi:fatty-acyl-CoA synthase
MYPGKYAAGEPGRIAAILAGTDEVLIYGELEERSVRLAHVLRDAGLRPGDVVALLTDNDLRAFEVYWAVMRSGMYLTAINHHLSADEATYIVADSGASALIVSAALAPLASAVAEAGRAALRLAFGGTVAGYASYADALAAASPVPFADQPQGAPMLYSAGTTGRPKGVRLALPAVQVDQIGFAVVRNVAGTFGVTAESVYLSPAPIYHAAPLRWCGAVQAHGGTVVMMKRSTPSAPWR